MVVDKSQQNLVLTACRSAAAVAAVVAVEKHRVPEGYAPPGLNKNAHHKLENKTNYLNTQCVAVLCPHHHVRHSPIIRVLEDSIENPTSNTKKKY